MRQSDLPQFLRFTGLRPASLLAAMAACAVCAVTSLKAQDSNDGFTAQKKPGIALVKPQPWSSPASAIVVEFKGFTDRTVANAPGAGYYAFDDGAGNLNQVPASRVVVMFIYPNIADIKTIVTAEDRQKVQASADNIASLESRFPASKAYIGSYARQLAAALQQYDSGQVEVDGQWISKDAYVKTKAQNLVGLLTDDIRRANPVSSFDLADDARYIQLQQLAEGQPALQAQVKGIDALYQKQARTEKRAQMVEQLKNPATTRASADLIVADLRKLQPEEDPAAMAYLRSWDSGLTRSADLDKRLMAAQAAFEAAVANVTPPTPKPSLPTDVITQADTASREVVGFKSTNPPPQLPVNMELATSLATTADGFSTLGSQFVLKQFFDAKATVDTIAPVAKNVGPNTMAAVAALQDYIARQILEFKSLRDDAHLLIKNKKPVDACAKFKLAYDVIQDPALKQEMDKLKGSLPQDSP